MAFQVFPLPDFIVQTKRLAKKHKSLPHDIAQLVATLELNPTLGTPLGGGAYKVRLSIKAKGKGKSGGARVITVVFLHLERLYLAYIYDKSEAGSISDRAISSWVAQAQKQLAPEGSADAPPKL